jgi:hypothetical protein
MPAVIDTPELIDIEDIETHDLTHDFTIEQCPARQARPGFWRTLAHGITTHLTPSPRERLAAVYSVPRPFETPLDRVVREYPSLALYAHAIL